MNKSKQLILGMMLGFEAGHEIYEGVDWDSDMAGELLAAKTITKDDIFSTTPNGKSFFQYEKTWEGLKKLFNLVSQNGEQITLDDLKKPIVDGKTALDMAGQCDAAAAIFAPELWVGHSDEMEHLWYTMDKSKRGNVDFEKVKSAVARLEGRTIREDQLKKAGIEPSEMHSAVKSGDIEKVCEKLAAHGDHLRLADAQLCDRDGDHALYARTGWDKFDKLLGEWAKHGEVPDVDFFLFSRGRQNSIIESAFQHSAADKVFSEKVFNGRPDEMIRLYKTLTEEQAEKVDISRVLSKVVENMCADMVQVDESLTLESLTDVLYKPGEEMDGWSPVIGLGLEKTWEHIDDVAAILKARGQAIGLAQLRLKSGAGGESCLLKAAKFGKFDKVLDLLAGNGERPALDDLLARDAEGKSLLDVLVEEGQVETLLRPGLWAGRVAALGQVWENIPTDKQGEVRDQFKAAYTEANLLSLRALGTRAGGPAPRLA